MFIEMTMFIEYKIDINKHCNYCQNIFKNKKKSFLKISNLFMSHFFIDDKIDH